MKKILIVSRVGTHPTRMGNNFAILAQVEMLKKLGCDVFFLYVQDRGLKADAIEDRHKKLQLMKEYWGDHLFVHHMTIAGKLWSRIYSKTIQRLRKGHLRLYQNYIYGTAKVVKRLDNKYHFDACIVQYIYQTKIFDYVKFPKMACFTHDTFAYANLAVSKDLAWYDSHQEAVALQKCTDVMAIQEEEQHYFKVLAPRSNHYTVFTPYDYHRQPYTGNKNILFLSGSYRFNVNGLKWFVNDVFPIIKQRHDDARLLIGGSICKVAKSMFSDNEGIEFLGYVDDPRVFFGMGDVAINPTYQGTGLKIKTFEAIANDKVTLVHPHSTNGIFKKDTAPIFASGEAADWANYLDEVWGNRELVDSIKKKNELYIRAMNEFIEGEYKRFVEY